MRLAEADPSNIGGCGAKLVNVAGGGVAFVCGAVARAGRARSTPSVSSSTSSTHDFHLQPQSIPRTSLDAHSLNARPRALLSARRRASDPPAAMTSAASTPERLPAASSIPHHVRRVVTLPSKLTGPAASAQVRDPETIEWLLHIEFARIVAFESSLSSSRPNSRSSSGATSAADGVRWSSPTETTLATGKTFLLRGKVYCAFNLAIGLGH